MENAKSMSALGRLGGRKSGAARRKRGEIQDLARKVLDTRFSPPPKLRAALESLGLCDGDKITVAAGILSVISGKALSGDLKAARFVLDVAGYTADAKERLAKARTLERMLDRDGDMPTPTIAPSAEEIDSEAQRLGVYD